MYSPTQLSRDALLREICSAFPPVFDQLQWAEQEIREAQLRHPERADHLFHSFRLLSADAMADRMSVEAVYRAHAREILERVARGEDTRPGTAVEVVIGLLAAAERAPLTHEGFALCARLWVAANLPEHDEFTHQYEHLEALHSHRTDREEAAARHACRNDDRKLGALSCDGWHHGEHVDCLFQ